MKSPVVLSPFSIQVPYICDIESPPAGRGARWLPATAVICLILMSVNPEVHAVADADRTISTDEWYERGHIRIGIRHDAVPFSYKKSLFQIPELPSSTDTPGAIKEGDWSDAAGFSVEICKEVIGTINGHFNDLGHVPVTVEVVSVSSSSRFNALLNDEIDMLCGSTSVTLERTKCIDFSLYTFVSGASFMFRTELALSTLSDLQGRRVGVLKDSTSSVILNRILKDANVPVMDAHSVEDVDAASQVMVVSVDSYTDVIDGFLPRDRQSTGNRDQLDAFFADREILMFLISRDYLNREGSSPGFLTVSGLSFSFEPYALAFTRKNPLLRYYANKTLTRLYNTNHIATIINKSFGSNRKSTLLDSLYQTQRIPDHLGQPICPQ